MMKLKAAFLGCTFLVAMGAAQGQLYFGADDPFATGHGQTPLNRDFRLTCEAIAKTISPASQVFFPGEFSSLCLSAFLYSFLNHFLSGTPEFKADISHWANSSTQVATCSVRPGKAEDVGLIVSSRLSATEPSSRCLVPADPEYTAASRTRFFSHTVCYQMLWAYHQPPLFVDARHPNLHDPIQRYRRSREGGYSRDRSWTHLDPCVFVPRA